MLPPRPPRPPPPPCRIAGALTPGRTPATSPSCVSNLSGNVHRSRHALNADTIREMHLAFRRGGRKAKVMRNQPAVFLKLLVLLVPRDTVLRHLSPMLRPTTGLDLTRARRKSRISSRFSAARQPGRGHPRDRWHRVAMR